jgi:histidinol-phosphate aminotransferase
MNRRAFVQTISAGAAGLALFDRSAAPALAGQVAARVGRPDMTGFVRIGSNENPYGPSASVLDAISKIATDGNRYPGPVQQQFVDTIAAKFNVPAEYVLLSGGSGDILRASVTAFTSKTKALVTSSPSYEAPMRTAQHVGAPLREVPLDANLRLDLGLMATRAMGAGLVYICNPNNPSSTAVTAAGVQALIEKVVKTSPTTRILVDEAYFEYSDLPGFDTAAPLTLKYPQVIVARTFSKIHAMAGMRAGYAIAQPKTLELMREYHSNSGMSAMTMAAAVASLTDVVNMERNRSLNREVRRKTVDAFESAGYKVAASDANFIFVNLKRDSKGFQESCRQKGILVGRSFPPLVNWARVSIGTAEEMDMALPMLMGVLSAPAPRQTASLDHLDALPSELT